MGDTRFKGKTTTQKIGHLLWQSKLFLKTMRYGYDNFSTIKWIVTNKIPFQCNNSEIESPWSSKYDCCSVDNTWIKEYF